MARTAALSKHATDARDGISSQNEARTAACLPLPLDRQRRSPLTSALDGTSDSDVLENPLIGDMARLVLGPSGTHHYLGNSSSTSLGLQFGDVVKSLKPDDYSADIDVDYSTCNHTAWPIARPLRSTIRPLPSYSTAMHLYAVQHMYIGTVFSFVDPHLFQQRLAQMYEKAPDLSQLDTCLSYCQIMLVFAYGQLYSINQSTGHDGPPGFSYFTEALEFLPDIREEGSLLFVEVLSLVGYFMMILNRRDTAFLYNGLAFRMAISLGLHQEVPELVLMDTSMRIYRRRLWWAVYSMDRILSCKSGNPISIADEDISVLPPSPYVRAVIPFTDVANVLKPGEDHITGSAAILWRYTTLTKILGDISTKIYRRTRQTASDLIVSVHGLLNNLSSWLHDLPEELRLNLTDMDKCPNLSREIISIYLHYFQCITMTARPLLFHVVQNRLKSQLGSDNEPAAWRQTLSPITVAVIDTCVSTAIDSTAVIHAAAKQNLIAHTLAATYGFMDSDHIFSTTMVLVMGNLATPYNARCRASTTTALSMLQWMAERGNPQSKARHEFLLDLRAKTKYLWLWCPPESQTADSRSETVPGVTTMPEPAIEACPSTSEVFGDRMGNDDTNRAYGNLAPLQLHGWDDELGVMDATFWEDSYGNLEVGMDFDWTTVAEK
ncbi:hypothetical protein V500_02392 [Pseudogymnoascus sp. VKM F-4518 (FW-2643)]|nr:hypothetical protein V500_02392 [Pseudogymnoascus sp. VKM F-4518 (FW-2643)]